MACLCGNGKKICHFSLPSSTKSCNCSEEALEKYCHLPECLAAHLALKNEQKKHRKSTKPRPEQRAVTKVTNLILSWVTQTETDPEGVVRKYLEQLEGHPARELERALSDAQFVTTLQSKVDLGVIRQFSAWLASSTWTSAPSDQSERGQSSDDTVAVCRPESFRVHLPFSVPLHEVNNAEAGAAGCDATHVHRMGHCKIGDRSQSCSSPLPRRPPPGLEAIRNMSPANFQIHRRAAPPMPPGVGPSRDAAGVGPSRSMSPASSQIHRRAAPLMPPGWSPNVRRVPKFLRRAPPMPPRLSPPQASTHGPAGVASVSSSHDAAGVGPSRDAAGVGPSRDAAGVGS
eukprot:CAMPEP_0204315864 /NCGR_PEP_ID=MMETSP0469-20131031/5083_1 /ASSEMBLY_ACC=CAM_ASM_000384 /TAXON_ID=2969 /ORGANISM="Oxyrrhis marina" /LENGTH=343 /DNA_ID=CAMNT_0051296583 /DNA_START=19 /DNA_END=1047 /DNA_ORIENTATION=+